MTLTDELIQNVGRTDYRLMLLVIGFVLGFMLYVSLRSSHANYAATFMGSLAMGIAFYDPIKGGTLFGLIPFSAVAFAVMAASMMGGTALGMILLHKEPQQTLKKYTSKRNVGK